MSDPELRFLYEDWVEEARRRFGHDQADVVFVCPACAARMSVRDYLEAGAPIGAIGYSCVGRWSGAKREAFGEGEGPCNYAGGGLFGLNPVLVELPTGEKQRVFEFAPAEDAP